MHSQFPDLVTVSIKRNVQLGDRMEVYTLRCAHYDHLKLKEEKSLAVTRLDRGNRNLPQWNQFVRLAAGHPLVVFSFWGLEKFWPTDRLESYHSENGKSIHDIAELACLIFPGELLQTLDELLALLARYSRQDESLPDDPTLRLFAQLTTYAASIDLKSIQDMSLLLSFEHPAPADWLARLSGLAVPRLESYHRLPENVRRPDESELSRKSSVECSIDSIFSVADPDPEGQERGPECATLTDFESRPEQVEYARQFEQALNNDEYFLAEAGTGTGKSLAYLVPALRYNAASDSRVVISTHTRNLQHQLFYKDLVQAEDLLGCRTSAVLLKGRTNYQCLLKMHIARGSASRKFDSKQLAELASILAFKDLTLSGDLSELTGISPAVRREVQCDPGFCPGARCVHYTKCFFFRARRAVGRSDVVVTNHALFFSDLMSEADILGKPGVVIFDEAHQIERVATDSMTGEISRSSLMAVFDPLDAIDPGMPNRIMSVAGIVSRNSDDSAVAAASQKIASDCGRDVSLCRNDTGRLFETIGIYISEHGLAPQTYSRKERLVDRHELLDLILDDLERLREDMRRLELQLGRLLQLVDTSELELDEIIDAESVQVVLNSLRTYTAHIENIIETDNEKWVRWLEVSPSGWYALKVAPVQIGEYLRKLLYDRYDRGLFTSATLTIERDFSFIEDRLGLEPVAEERKRKRVFGSSFDFGSQVRFVCTAFLPSPRTDFYQQRLSAFLRQLLQKIKVNTLVLFTSYQSLLKTARDLEGRVPRIIVQEGPDAADKAIHDFMQMKPAVLLGTESFWQGVDLPGDLLELLIITRLPFSVPGDPIDTARMEEVERKGLNSFASYSLPSAVLRFKQGFGRLIRTGRDQGAIVVTDNRLVKSSFGQVFLNSVPSEIEIATCFEEVISSVDSMMRRNSSV